MKIKHLILVLLFSCIKAGAQDTNYISKRTKSYFLKTDQTYNFGYGITLPKVLLSISVTQKQATISPGNFFCKEGIQELRKRGIIISELANDDNLDILKEGKKLIEYEIGVVTATPFSIPDESKRFLIIPGKKWNKDQSIELNYGEGNGISAISMTNTDKTASILSVALTTAVGILGEFMFKDADNSSSATRVQKDNYNTLTEYQKSLLSNKELRRFDSIYNIYAQLEIKKLSIINYLGAMTPPETFNRQISLIEANQKRLLELITWKSTENLQTVQMDLNPCDLLDGLINVFYFSDTAGIVVNIDLYKKSYKQYTLPNGIKQQSGDLGLQKISLKIENPNQMKVKSSCIDNDNLRSQYDKIKIARKNDQYLIPYNLPVISRVTVSHVSANSNKQLLSLNLSIPQFGGVGYASGKNVTNNISYDSLTGALKSVKFISNAILTDDVKAGGASVTSLIKTLNPAKKTELELLIAERLILEEKKKIKDLKLEIGQ